VHTIVTAPRIAEFWLIAYLLIKGVRTPGPDRIAPDDDTVPGGSDEHDRRCPPSQPAVVVHRSSGRSEGVAT